MKQSMILRLYNKSMRYVKNDPSFVLRFACYVLFIVVYFPKFLWYSASHPRIFAIDWYWKHYGSFFHSIYSRAIQLLPPDVKVLFFFRFDLAGDSRYPVFRQGLPAFYRNFIDRKVVLAADSSKYKKLAHTVRIQMFHGFASFGSVWSVEQFIEPFDVFFLTTYYQQKQLQTTYRHEIGSRHYHLVGYPKLDELVSKVQRTERSHPQTTLFYGPTWHQEISSIFDFLPCIIDLCIKYDYRLFIKLHPYLYHKNSITDSGGVDWVRKIHFYQQCHPKLNLTLVAQDISLEEQGQIFAETDLFLTDVSGIGFEYVLTTGNPIVFLGERLKIPIEDLVSNQTDAYQQYPEIYYRGLIGPVARTPDELDDAVCGALRGDYRGQITSFAHSFIPNVGTASGKACELMLGYLTDL